MDISVVLPERSNDSISEALRELTRFMCENKVGDDCDSSFGLGGDYGYGVNFENDVFMMHRYCWCEQSDCPWCAGCECPESADHYLVDGKEVTYDDWAAFYLEQVGPSPDFNDDKAMLGAKKLLDYRRS